MTVQPIEESRVDPKILSTLALCTRSSAAWVNLQTSEGWPGRALFERVRDRVLASPDLRDTLIVECDYERPGREPELPTLGPLGNSLYYLDPARKLGYLARVRARLKGGTRRDWLIWVLRQCFFFLVLALIFGVTLRITGFDKSPWILALAVVLSIAIIPLGDRWLKIESPGSDAPNPTAEELRPYKNVAKITEILGAIAGKASRILLLIDNLNRLNKAEMTVLDNVTSTAPNSVVKALLNGRGLVAVTLDPQRSFAPMRSITYQLPDQPAELGDMTDAVADRSRQKIDIEARSLVAEWEGGKQGSWGVLELLAICVTDLFHERSETSWREILNPNPGSCLSRSLDRADLLPETDPFESFRKITASGLYAPVRRSYYREHRLASGVSSVLSREHPALLKEAYQFWFEFYSDAVKKDDNREFVYRYATSAGEALAEGADPQIDVALLGALVEGAAYWRDQGETELSSQNLLLCHKLSALSRAALPESLFEDLAREWAILYSVSGLPQADGNEEKGVPGRPCLTAAKGWQVHVQQVRELRLGGSLMPMDESSVCPELRSLSRANAMGAALRNLGGEAAYSDPALELPQPLSLAHADMNEFGLRSALVYQADARVDEVGFKREMQLYRARLDQVRPAGDQLGLQAVWLLARAKYHVNLLSYYVNRTDSSPANSDQQRALEKTVQELALDGGDDAASSLARRTRTSVEQALRLANLLLLRGLSISATVWLGYLLYRCPDAFSEPDPLWWQSWDRILEASLQECADLDWITLEAVIRFERASFFKTIDVRSAAWDRILLYDAVVRSGYPPKFIAEHNKEITDELSGVNLPKAIHIRLAQMHEDLSSMRVHLNNSDTRAPEEGTVQDLIFAAQHFRLADDTPSARAALIRAWAITSALWTNADREAIEDRQTRNLAYVFYSECGDLPTENGDPLPRLDAKERWRILDQEDFYLPYALMILTKSDPKEALAPWTQPPECAYIDPVNPRLSLVTGEDGSPGPAPQTVYEFRVRLLLGWLTGNSWAAPGDVPNKSDLWGRFCKPGDTVVALAMIGAQIRGIPELDEIVSALLEQTWRYASHIKPNDRLEHDALELLKDVYRHADPAWRERYIEVCSELAELMEREAEQSRGYDNVNFVDLVSRIESYLLPLLDPEARDKYNRNGSLGGDDARRQGELLDEARKLLDSGDSAECWVLLEPLLQTPEDRSVSILDLRILDTAQRCAARDPRLERQIPLLNHRMRELVVRYAEYFATAIRGEEAREVARRIANHVLHIVRLQSSAAVSADEDAG
jgi:hypothetical protein